MSKYMSVQMELEDSANTENISFSIASHIGGYHRQDIIATHFRCIPWDSIAAPVAAAAFALVTAGNGFGPDVRWFDSFSTAWDTLRNEAEEWWEKHFGKPDAATPRDQALIMVYAGHREREEGYRYAIIPTGGKAEDLG